MKLVVVHNRSRTFLLSISFLSILLLGLLTAVSARGQQMADLSDFGILSAIEEELRADPAINTNRIIVTVTSGKATLAGSVPSLLDKERAERLAKTVLGVIVVDNQLKVNPIGIISESVLQQNIYDALLINSATDSYELRVTVDKGIVELAGTVDSFAERELAEKVTKNVRGVKAIRNLIKVNYALDRIDSEIALDVQEMLRWDALVDNSGIAVRVKDGTVFLSGRVGSLAEKDRAVNDAWVAGVKAVQARDLNVGAGAMSVVGAPGLEIIITDQDLQKAVKNALLYDPLVDSSNISVTADDGLITLSGQVDSLMAYNAAEFVTRTRLGTERVRNHLKITPAEPVADEKIAADIRKALVLNPYVDRYEIVTSVNDGTVRLSGRVDTAFERSQAGLSASQVNGVELVINNIQVENFAAIYIYDPYVDFDFTPEMLVYEYRPGMTGKSDLEIFSDIYDQLLWSPFVDVDQVEVVVNAGVATLTGQVDSAMEADAAVKNAFDGGALWVLNLLEIK